jgi:hypothetical protein
MRLLYPHVMRKRLPLFGLAVAALLLRLLAYKIMAIPFGGLTTAMCQYDCGWYVRLAQDGYLSDSHFDDFGFYPNWAFFPLFPFLFRAALLIAPSLPFLVGMLLTNTLFLGVILIGARYLQQTRPAVSPSLWVMFIIIFPFGYIYSAIYSEPLFALLLIAALLMLEQRRILLCAIITALLCATRPTGILLLVPIAIERGQHLWAGRTRTDRVALLGETLLPIAIAPLGLSLYMLWQYIATGDGMAFNHVQVLWDRSWKGPLHYLIRGLSQWDWNLILRPKDAPSESYDAAWALVGLAAAGWLGWQRRFTEAWMLAGTVLLPISTQLHSLPRFVGTSPLFLFVAMEALARIRRPEILAACFGVMGLFQGVMVIEWFIAANVTY